jgi:hypothetical protein
MKNTLLLIALIALSLFSSLVYSNDFEVDFEVEDDTISITAREGWFLSWNSDESEVLIEKGQRVSFNVTERVVIRSETSKLSFSPLADVANPASIIGPDVPKSYSKVMTLFQSFYTGAAKANRECLVIVLDKSLQLSHQTRLRNFLSSNGVGISEKEGYLTFDCNPSN